MASTPILPGPNLGHQHCQNSNFCIHFGIAPAKIILKEFGAKRVINYISRDFVPLLDTRGLKLGLAEGSVIDLSKPALRHSLDSINGHKTRIPWWDHDFQSPTYESKLEHELSEFKERFYCE